MSDSFIRSLPQQAETPNVRALASFRRDVMTPVGSQTVLTLAGTVISGTEQVFQAGALLSPSAYTVTGSTITLGTPANGTDEYQVHYHFVNR